MKAIFVVMKALKKNLKPEKNSVAIAKNLKLLGQIFIAIVNPNLGKDLQYKSTLGTGDLSQIVTL